MTNHSNSSNYFNQVSIEKKIWYTACIVVGFLTVVLNLATIVVFLINRHLRRSSVYCLINLAVADMLFGASVIAIYSMWIVILLGRTNETISQIFYFTYHLKLFTSLFSLVVVSLERVYVTFFPFRHRTTRLRMYIVVFTITWLLPLPPVTTYNFYTKSDNILTLNKIFLVIFLLCLIIICTSYTAIFVKVKIQAKRLLPNQQQTAAIQTRQKREQHLAMTLFIVTVLSLITWLPFIIRAIILMASYNIPYKVSYLLFLIQRTNSLINPIIYVFRMRDFRKALSQLIFKCSRDHQHIHPIGHHGNYDRQQQPPTELQVM